MPALGTLNPGAQIVSKAAIRRGCMLAVDPKASALRKSNHPPPNDGRQRQQAQIAPFQGTHDTLNRGNLI